MKKQNTLPGQDFYTLLAPLLLKIRPSEIADILKYLLGFKRRVVQTESEQVFWVDPASHFGQEILTTRTYEPQMTQLIRFLLRPSDTFVDVGANEGYFAVVAAHHSPQGTVHCIEPQTRLQEVIAKNIELNHLKNIHIHPLALAEHDGSVELYLRPSVNSGSSSLFKSNRLTRKKETVAALSFGSFVSKNKIEHIRLLKIDCEGAEDLVVFGGKEVFVDCKVDFIALEYHHSIRGHEKLDQVHAFLEKCGYQLKSIHHQSLYCLRSLEKDLVAFEASYLANG